jgi:putative ABC transport system permease protein
MWKNILKIAWRNLLRNRTTSLINLSGLTVGMTAAFFIFMWVENELSYDRYHPDAEHIYRLKYQWETWVSEMSPFPLGEVAKNQLPEVETISRLQAIYQPPTVNINNYSFKETNAAYVDANWFRLFHFDFIEGNPEAFSSQLYSVVLSESNAKRYFGNESALGKSLRIDTIDYQIQGVVKDYPANSSFRYNMFLRLKPQDPDEWGSFGYLTFVKISPTANPESVADKFDAILSSNRKSDDYKFSLTPLGAMHFEQDLRHSVLVHGNRKMVGIFMVLGGLLLSIACINYVNLTTARATTRIKEVGVRKIVGAGRKHLFIQFLVESALLGFLALIATLLLATLSLPAFNRFTENHFVLSFTDISLWQLLGGTFVANLVLSSIYPALLLSSFSPTAAFRGSSIWKIKDTLLRKSLVVMQFATSIILIAGTIVIYLQMQFISQQNAGYDKSQVLSFRIPFKIFSQKNASERNSMRATIKQQLLAQSSIENVSVINGSSAINNSGLASGGADWDGREPDFNPGICFYETDFSFKQLINLQLKEGRWFLPDSKADESNTILNETAVRDLGLQQPVIGQRFVSRGDSGVVIGVVKDFYYKSMHERIGPVVINIEENFASTFLVKIAAGRHMEAEQAVGHIWKQFIPDEPFEYHFLDDEFDNLYKADRKATSLIWAFSILAIFVSCLGLYGLATFSAERRNKEIGIRKVFGASVSSIAQKFSTEFLKLVFIGILIASPFAWWVMNKWLEDFAYRIEIKWWMMALAGLIALAIALVTVSFQSIKAALTNPLDSLRSE